MRNKGFTLVEIVVVLAVIAILITILVPAATKSIAKAKASNQAALYNSVKTAYAAYYADTGLKRVMFPSEGLVVNGFSDSTWNGPYLDKIPQNNYYSGAVQLNKEGQIQYSAANYFDLDGNGTGETQGYMYRMYIADSADRQQVDAALDNSTLTTWEDMGVAREDATATYLDYLILPD
ncbi:MAG: prepilin-type N-terminal cleavage/methylation domain-containing protein [Candidatus Omnitrophota bacterium]